MDGLRISGGPTYRSLDNLARIEGVPIKIDTCTWVFAVISGALRIKDLSTNQFLDDILKQGSLYSIKASKPVSCVPVIKDSEYACTRVARVGEITNTPKKTVRFAQCEVQEFARA